MSIEKKFRSMRESQVETKKAINLMGVGVTDLDTFASYPGKVALIDEPPSLITLRNDLVNGDFSNGINPWESSNALIEIDVSKKEIKSTATGRLAQLIQTISNPTDHKIYMRVEVRADNLDCNLIAMSVNNFGGRIDEFVPTSIENFTMLSGIDQQKTFFFRIYHRYTTEGNANGNSVFIRKPLIIDLTEIFGEGNEPTKLEMDDVIDNIGWFVDEEQVIETEFQEAYLKMSNRTKEIVDVLLGVD